MISKTHIRTLFIAGCLWSNIPGVYSQNFPTDTVIKKGPLNNRINFVYMSDGYLASELNTFITDVTGVNNKLFLTTPFKEYINYFNVFQVRVPSAESGAKHANSAPDCPAGGSQPTINPRNYFGSRFDVFGIHRLLAPDSMAKISSVLSSNLASYDQCFIVANSQYYGGSGGAFPTTSTHSLASEIAIHELGHSFGGGLADEYWAGSVYAAEKANMTAQADPLLVKWKNWVGVNNVGVYPYIGGPGWYRPVQGGRCKMEVLGVNFCSVCTEALIEGIHNLVNPVDNFTPANGSPVAASTGNIGFKLNLVLPIPNTLKTNWKLDGSDIAMNVDTVTLNSALLSGGNHTLLATVTDTTQLSRSATHISVHTYNTQWIISRVTGITSAELFRANLKVFPNPFASDLVVQYQLDKKANVSIELVSTDGKRITHHERKGQLAGQHSFTIDTRKEGISAGMYFVIFSLNGQSLTKQMIKVE
jgi:IgA Peptidase M64/Secretion system C-terminal sorting domain